MSEVTRRFISKESPTAGRNGAGYRPCQGLYYTSQNTRPKTALIATHYNVDFSEHYLGDELAERGFGFLGWNTRYRGAEAYFLLEHALVDIGVGLRWLREEAGVERVVLLGNSGGGSLMAAYQSQARSPVLRASAGLPDAVFELPVADRYVSLNAHPGRPEVMTAWMDPAVADENDPASVVADLDMFNPEQGPPYPVEFVVRYRAAQVERNNRITTFAREELRRLSAKGLFDRLFTVPRTWADLRFLDGSIDPSGRAVGRCYAGDPKRANYSPFGIGHSCTLRTWLSMWSLEASQCRAIPHLQRIVDPALVIQSRGDTGVFPSDAELIFASLASEKKELAWLESDHYLEAPPKARGDVADRIEDWLDGPGV